MAALVPELSVSDIAVSKRFYCDLLGFSVVYRWPEEGFAYLALGAAVAFDDLKIMSNWPGRVW